MALLLELKMLQSQEIVAVNRGTLVFGWVAILCAQYGIHFYSNLGKVHDGSESRSYIDIRLCISCNRTDFHFHVG